MCLSFAAHQRYLNVFSLEKNNQSPTNCRLLHVLMRKRERASIIQTAVVRASNAVEVRFLLEFDDRSAGNEL